MDPRCRERTSRISEPKGGSIDVCNAPPARMTGLGQLRHFVRPLDSAGSPSSADYSPGSFYSLLIVLWLTL